MPKQNTHPIIQLINSMTKAEKRHFKLMARRNAGSTDSLFILLFDHLDKHNNLDDQLILKQIPNIKKSQISNIKSNLYKQLLASLRLFHRNNNTEIHLSEQLDYARVLYDKGLYKASLEILDKAKQLSLANKQFLIAQNIVEFEKLIESQHITGSMSAKADQLYEESAFLVNRNVKTVNLSSASLQLYGLYLRYGYVRNENDYEFVSQFFNEHIPKYEVADLDFFERLYLYQSYVWYSNMTHDFLNYYKYAQRWVNLFHEYPKMMTKDSSLYIKGLHNVLNALFLTGKYDKFLSNYNELDQFLNKNDHQLNKNEESLATMFLNIHKINLHYMEGSFSEGLNDISKLENLIATNVFNWDKHRIMVFYYKLASLYFGAGKNEEAIHYLNLIINNFLPSLREDIQSFARILNLIAHFELGNKILISYQIISVYRFLYKMNDLHGVQKEILEFLRRTPKISPKDINKEFLLLKERLITIQEDPFEKRPFFYLDIISWLESKVEGVSVESVIRRKFEVEQGKLLSV